MAHGNVHYNEKSTRVACFYIEKLVKEIFLISGKLSKLICDLLKKLVESRETIKTRNSLSFCQRLEPLLLYTVHRSYKPSILHVIVYRS